MTTQEWIDSLGVDANEKAVLQGVAARKPEAFNGYLTQSDYSRKMNELATERKRLEEDFNRKQAEVDSFKNTLVGTRDRMNKEYKTAIAERDAAKAELMQTQSRMKAIADQHGIEVGDLPATPVTPAATPAAIDHSELDKKYYGREEAYSDAVGNAMLVATFNDFTTEYFELTGKRPVGARQVMEKAIENLKAGRTVKFEELLDQHYGMSELRQNRSTTEAKEREDAIRRDERQKVQSEMMVNTATGARHDANSPALRFAEKQAAARAGSPDNTTAGRSLRVANMLQEEAVKAATA